MLFILNLGTSKADSTRDSTHLAAPTDLTKEKDDALGPLVDG